MILSPEDIGTDVENLGLAKSMPSTDDVLVTCILAVM